MIRDRTLLLASLVLTASLTWITARWSTTVEFSSIGSSVDAPRSGSSRSVALHSADGESSDSTGSWRPRTTAAASGEPLAMLDDAFSSTIGSSLPGDDWGAELAGATIHAEAYLVPETPAAPSELGSEHAVPGALPNAPHAIPINQRSAPINPELEALLARELGELSEAERNIWREVLRELPTQQAEEILQIWKLTGASVKGFPPELTAPAPTPPRPAPGAAPGKDAAATLLAPAERAALAEILRQNIEHINTPGYRRREPGAGGVAPGPGGAPETEAAAGLRAGRLDLTRGPVRTTTNPLDVAIDGVGFFMLRRDEQLVCTRCGRFDLTEAGQLVQIRAEGVWHVDPPITVPKGARGIIIRSDGRVLADGADGENELQECGRLELATFLNPQHLETVAGDLLRPTAESGPLHRVPAGGAHGSLQQGALEASNATLTSEAAILEQLERQADLLRRAARLTDPGVAH